MIGLTPGQIVGGYQILERVDQGARREVYKARAAKARGMRDDGYRYAVKIYTEYPEDASDFIS